MDHVIDSMLTWFEVYRDSVYKEAKEKNCNLTETWEWEDLKAIVKATNNLIERDSRYEKLSLAEIKSDFKEW